jgi:hypothetical protein
MADCAVCRNLQRDEFDSLDTIQERQLTIPRRALSTSAQAGCETCLVIYDAWKAAEYGISAYRTYVCLLHISEEVPLRIVGKNIPMVRVDEDSMSQIYTLQG